MFVANLTSKRLWFLQIFLFAIIFNSSTIFTNAQSTNQERPTPITEREIKGEIPPRSVGDPRLTNYYFTFNGSQGDVFVNVVTNNLDGDIDIFTMDGLEPLTKIPVFAGVQENETGRVIYLRKPEKLILRIQGRTPNDDPAEFQIKFAGSFVPLENLAENENADPPKVENANKGVARVNSVGTIIEVFPTPIPRKDETISESIEERESENIKPTEKQIVIGIDEKADETNATRIEISKEPIEETVSNEADISKASEGDQKATGGIVAERADKSKTDLELVFSDIFGDKKDSAEIDSEKIGEVSGKSDADRAKNTDDAGIFVEGAETDLKSDETSTGENNNTSAENKATEIQPVEPAQLANIKLVIRFKNGTKFSRSMDRIVWFNVDKGILTVITLDGNILKFSMLDVEKMTFETEK